MPRTTIALIAGLLIGALAAVAIISLQHEDHTAAVPVVRDIAGVPKMDDAVADQHRMAAYADIDSIDEIAALPTQFARASAMHALASRLDSAGVQNLIYETDRISDNDERGRLLEALFFRFAELDPQSALVLSRTDRFAGNKALEGVVWHAWAREDLDEALFAAKTQTSLANQNFAAQSLYAAFGYLENNTIDRIEVELGIKPDRRTRSRYLYRLADRSIDEAIAFINANANAAERIEYASWLAHHVSLRDPAEGLAHADKFAAKADGYRFRSLLEGYVARSNPRETIENFLASGRPLRDPEGVHSAIRELAVTDLEALKEYFGQVHSSENRHVFGSAIAMAMAQNDPDEALAWARAHDDEMSLFLINMVLGQIAQTDPERAFSMAMATADETMRSQTLGTVVQQVARRDPAWAAAFIDQIPDDAHRVKATQSLIFSWLSRDVDAAVDWILGQDKKTADQLLQMSASQLALYDVDAAIRVLPEVNSAQQVTMRQQIARRLAISRSPQEAEAFIRQFENQGGYDRLQASMIAGLAETDPSAARQLADQLAPGKVRDSVYMQVIMEQSTADPSRASAWLQGIGNEATRAVAAGQVAMHWYMQDSQAATRWVNTLPGGEIRDSAIMRMSSEWLNPTQEQVALIASIDNREKRGQAKIRWAYNLFSSNPDKARQLLEDEDIPAAMRERAKAQLAEYGYTH